MYQPRNQDIFDVKVNCKTWLYLHLHQPRHSGELVQRKILKDLNFLHTQPVRILKEIKRANVNTRYKTLFEITEQLMSTLNRECQNAEVDIVMMYLCKTETRGTLDAIFQGCSLCQKKKTLHQCTHCIEGLVTSYFGHVPCFDKSLYPLGDILPKGKYSHGKRQYV